MKTPALCMLLLFSLPAFSQGEADTTNLEDMLGQLSDSIAYYQDSAYTYEDSLYSHVVYTQKPGDLAVTKQELEKKYQPRKFSKTEWRRITGNTNYQEDVEKEKKPPVLKQFPNMQVNPFVFKVLPYLFIFGLICFLIYLFIKQALNASGTKTRQQQAALYSDQTTPEDLGNIDLDKLIRDALAQKNLRLAVRLYYIKLLKHLDQEGYIRWEKNKTNRDYADELGVAGISREFRKLMNAYEYVWYGERTPSPEEFTALESNFRDLYKTSRA